MDGCTFVHQHPGNDPDPCPREAYADADRCVFHISPEQRDRFGLSSDDVTEQFLAEVRSESRRRSRLKGAHLERFDLGAARVGGTEPGPVVLRDCTVDGALDLSESAVDAEFVVESCHLGVLRTSEATFEDDLVVRDSVLGGDDQPGTPLVCRRTAVEGSLRLVDTAVRGNAELPACRVDGRLGVEGSRIEGRTQAPNAEIETLQVIQVTADEPVAFQDATVGQAVVEDVTTSRLEFGAVTVDTLRVLPETSLMCSLRDATVHGGRLDQPAEGTANYDLTDATVGDVSLGCSPDTFDRYRFYRTRFDGFPFASYRVFLRANDWLLHDYAGPTEESPTPDGLELTYLQAKRGATDVGDSENASAFFIREMRFRRRRYAAHLRNGSHSPSHRLGAGLRWVTNVFLDAVAGYGERLGRVVGLATALVTIFALAYPAVGGIDAGTRTVTYASDGAGALVDSLYFSVATFATLGLGDVQPTSQTGQFLAASEALSGAFLTALFVFALGRRVTR